MYLSVVDFLLFLPPDMAITSTAPAFPFAAAGTVTSHEVVEEQVALLAPWSPRDEASRFGTAVSVHLTERQDADASSASTIAA